jgi:hypothetical protein
LLKRLLLARGWERGVKKINRSLPIVAEAVQIPNRRNFVRHLRRYSGQELRIVDDGLWQRTVGVMGDKVC